MAQAKRRSSRPPLRPDDPDACHEAALRLVERRLRTAADVRARLVRRGFLVETVDGEVRRLARVGLVDDAAVAAALARERSGPAPGGRLRLRADLRRLRVSELEAQAVLAAFDEDAALEQAVAEFRRRLADRANAERCLRYLLQRGFSRGRALAAARRFHAPDHELLE